MFDTIGLYVFDTIGLYGFDYNINYYPYLNERKVESKILEKVRR